MTSRIVLQKILGEMGPSWKEVWSKPVPGTAAAKLSHWQALGDRSTERDDVLDQVLASCRGSTIKEISRKFGTAIIQRGPSQFKLTIE